MRRAALVGLAAFLAFAAGAAAQLVPVSTCHAALPCSIPYGLRPADSLANNPYGNVSNTGPVVATSIDQGWKPRLVVKPVSEDPAEYAARIFVRKNPHLSKPTPVPPRPLESVP